MSSTGGNARAATAQRIPAYRLAAFAAPSIPIAALGLPMVVYLPEFYANAMGLSLGTVGWAFMLIRLIDIGFDPLLGGTIDRTAWRWGRFRGWLLVGLPLLMAGVMAAFSPPASAGRGYLVAALLLLHLAYSICHIAHMSWGARLSSDYDQRSRIYGWWQGANIVGMIAILLLPVLVAGRGPGPVPVVPAMGLAIVVALPLTIALAAISVPDPPAVATRKAHPFAALALLRRAEVRRLLLSDLAFGLAPGLAGAAFLFFFREVKGLTAAQSSLLLLANFIAALFGAPLWSRLARKLEKHRALALAGVWYAAGQASLYLMPAGSIAVGIAQFAVIGLPFAAPPLLLRAMMADVADLELLEHGADRAGMLFSLVTAVSKLGYALSVGLAFVALDAVGFVARGGTGNSTGAIGGLQWIYLGAPAILALLGALLIARYPIDRARHEAVRAALAERCSA